MSDEFNQPSSGGGFFEPKHLLGRLVLITRVHEVYHNPNNVYAGKPQPRDEAKIDVVDLDGDGNLRERVIATHPGVVNKLAAGATNVLGRIGTVPTDKGNDAYVLNGHESADVDKARAWLEAYKSGQFGQPQGQAAQAASQGHQQAQPVQNQGQATPVAQAPAQAGQAAPQGIQLPPGVDQAQLAALMAQMGAQQVQQQPGQGQPTY